MNSSLAITGKNFTITYVTIVGASGGGSVVWTGSQALGDNYQWDNRIEISKDKFAGLTKDSKIKIEATFDNNWQIKVRTINSESLQIPAWNNTNVVQTGMNGVNNNYVEFSPGTDNFANMIVNDGLLIFGKYCTVTKVSWQ